MKSKCSLFLLLFVASFLTGCGGSDAVTTVDMTRAFEQPQNQEELISRGRDFFRYDTFGDEQLWTDTLGLHQVIESSVDPMTALSVGLKVDSEKLPEGLLEDADLTDPETTLKLIELDAVVGVKGDVEVVEGKLSLTRFGVTCALCHSTVDNSVTQGVGKRLDGWPNRDLDPGFIIALSPNLDEETKDVYRSWGPGKYDAYFNLDGLNNPTVIPPAYGLKNVAVETFTGEGPMSYWNAYVAVTQMGGQGTFVDPELGIDIQAEPDLVTPKLAALKAYQESLLPPAPTESEQDQSKIDRGRLLFEGVAQCATCHTGESFTDANSVLHDPSEVGTSPILASRSKTGKYRTTPLRGAWQHPPYFHDGSAPTLEAVVDHYNQYLSLGLTADQKDDLTSYVRSL